MKEMIKDFFGILANCLIALCMAFAGFTILINLYHIKTISYEHEVDKTISVAYIEFKENIATVKKNITNPDYSKMTDAKKKQFFSLINISLDRCLQSIEKADYYNKTGKISVSSTEVYKMATEYYNGFYSKCISQEINSINDLAKRAKYSDQYLENTLSYIQVISKQLGSNNQYVSSGLLGNSSYSFVTELSKATIYNQIADSYNLISENYLYASRMLKQLSEWSANSIKEAK